MAFQTFTLTVTGTNFSGSLMQCDTGGVLIKPELVQGGGTAYLSRVRLWDENANQNEINVEIRTNATSGQTSGLSPGPDLVSAFETGGTVRLEAGSSSVSLPMSALTVNDTEEPYDLIWRGDSTLHSAYKAVHDQLSVGSTITLTIDDGLERSLPSIQDFSFTPGSGFTLTLPEAVGGVEPWSYAVTYQGGGLTLDSATRRLSGTPDWVGNRTITYTATDANGASVSTDFVIAVEYPALVLPNISDLQAYVNSPFDHTFPQASGGNPPYTYTIFARGSATLPAWATVDNATRRIYGTPTGESTTPMAYRVQDSNGTVKRDNFNLSVSTRPLVSFTATSYQVTPGMGSNMVDVEVRLSEALDREVTIPIIMDFGPNTDATEVIRSSTSVTFAIGETSKTFTVTTLVTPNFTEWETVTRFLFSAKDSDGVSRGQIFQKLKAGATIGIRHDDPGEVDQDGGLIRAAQTNLLVYDLDGDVVHNGITGSGSAYIFPVKQAFHRLLEPLEAAGRTIVPPHDENFDLILNIPYTAEADLGGRGPRWLQYEVRADVADDLAATASTADWPLGARIAANEAFRVSDLNPLQSSDVITLFKNDRTWTRTWDLEEAAWVSYEGFIGGDLLVSGGIISDHISTNAIEARHIGADEITGDKIAAGTITADKITASLSDLDATQVTAFTDNLNQVRSDIDDLEFGDLGGQLGLGDLPDNLILANHIGAGQITAEKAAFEDLLSLGLFVRDANILGTITAQHIQADLFNVYGLYSHGSSLGREVASSNVSFDFEYPTWLDPADITDIMVIGYGSVVHEGIGVRSWTCNIMTAETLRTNTTGPHAPNELNWAFGLNERRAVRIWGRVDSSGTLVGVTMNGSLTGNSGFVNAIFGLKRPTGGSSVSYNIPGPVTGLSVSLIDSANNLYRATWTDPTGETPEPFTYQLRVTSTYTSPPILGGGGRDLMGPTNYLGTTTSTEFEFNFAPSTYFGSTATYRLEVRASNSVGSSASWTSTGLAIAQAQPPQGGGPPL